MSGRYHHLEPSSLTCLAYSWAGMIRRQNQLHVLELGSHTGVLSMWLELLHNVGNTGLLTWWFKDLRETV